MAKKRRRKAATGLDDARSVSAAVANWLNEQGEDGDVPLRGLTARLEDCLSAVGCLQQRLAQAAEDVRALQAAIERGR